MATYNREQSGRWRVQIRRKGMQPQARVFSSKEEARRWAEQIEGKHAAGELLDLSEARRTTLAEALERYRAEVSPTKKGAKAEADRIRQWQRHPLAARPLASIRSHDIAEWRNELVAAGKAPTTVRNAVTIISQVYKTAASEWGMSGLQNPVAGVRMPKLRPGRERRLQSGEEDRLLAGCRALGCAWMPSLVVMALETAMRLGELLSSAEKTSWEGWRD